MNACIIYTKNSGNNLLVRLNSSWNKKNENEGIKLTKRKTTFILIVMGGGGGCTLYYTNVS